MTKYFSKHLAAEQEMLSRAHLEAYQRVVANRLEAHREEVWFPVEAEQTWQMYAHATEHLEQLEAEWALAAYWLAQLEHVDTLREQGRELEAWEYEHRHLDLW